MTRRGRWSVLAALTAVALLGAACGGGASLKQGAGPTASEESSSTPAPEAAPATESQEGAPTAEGQAPAGAPTGNAPAAAQGSASSGSKASGTKTGSAAAPKPGQAAKPGSAASATPGKQAGGKANYASDVGVTADVVKIGLINMASATRSLGPVIAVPSEKVVDSAVKYINRTGGISGRKLQLLTCDDGGNVSRARACYEKLKGEVFAFVPSETWITDVIHDTHKKDGVPWLSWGWFKSEYENPIMFPCHSNGIREAIAMSKWVADNLKPATVGILYLNVTEDIAATNEAKKVMESKGIRVVQTVAQEWDSPDESQHVLSMRAANPDHVLSFSWPAPMAKFFHDARGQNWSPPKGFSANHLIGDPGYGPIFTDYIKGRLYSITSWLTNADNTPELQLYREETRRNYGDGMLGFKWRYGMGHHISQSGWVCTRIFAKAAAELGPDLKRPAFMKVLESKAWDSGMGVTMTWSPGDHTKDPYSFNTEFMYKWIEAKDGGWDTERKSPDPKYKG
jgi:ABC-type branched-subunit amino acid transport system substrate-binding protein